MCLCTSSTQIKKFQTQLITQTAVRTVFVVVAQKLGNPTSINFPMKDTIFLLHILQMFPASYKRQVSLHKIN
jgi:hypothetical protein